MHLTDRQIAAWRLASLGHANEEMSRTLHISMQTGKNHLAAIRFHLGARNAVEMALAGYVKGVASPEDIQAVLQEMYARSQSDVWQDLR